jgi:hypothetical protein
METANVCQNAAKVGAAKKDVSRTAWRNHPNTNGHQVTGQCGARAKLGESVQNAAQKNHHNKNRHEVEAGNSACPTAAATGNIQREEECGDEEKRSGKHLEEMSQVEAQMPKQQMNCLKEEEHHKKPETNVKEKKMKMK